MTSTEFLTAVPSLKKVNKVSFSPKLNDLLQNSLKTTLKSGKELGIFSCGKEKGNGIYLNDGILLTSIDSDSDSFWFDRRSLPSIEKTICGNGGKLMALLHFHPDGNITPSVQDRCTSTKTDLMGCVVGIGGARCYYGNKDFDVESDHVNL